MKTKIKIKVKGIKTANKYHLDACTRFPARVEKNKKAYDRKNQKQKDNKIINSVFY